MSEADSRSERLRHNLLRQVHGHVDATWLAVENGDWESVIQHTFEARALLEEIGQEALRQTIAVPEGEESVLCH